MSDFDTAPCDMPRLNRYIDGELTSSESAAMERHLTVCPSCRRQVDRLSDFSEQFRKRVAREAASVDFAALEKAVVIKALRRYHRRERGGIMRSLKIAIPALATAGVLIFLGYSHLLVKPAPMPSAIINSFTGPASSVMIFETPKTRQTILWYTEPSNTEKR